MIFLINIHGFWIKNFCRHFLVKLSFGLVAENMDIYYLPKRYFLIDQQIAGHFVQYSESLSNPSSMQLK